MKSVMFSLASFARLCKRETETAMSALAGKKGW